MINVIKYSFLFIGIILAQIFIFNQIELGNLFTPYFYVLFILLLPFDTPKTMLLILSFLLGLSVDLFIFTPGMHAASCTLVAFIRPSILKWNSPRDDYDAASLPTMYYYGFAWFVRYTITVVLIHHFALFYIEMFRLSDFFFTFLRVILSTLLTSALIILSQFFILRQ